MTRRSARIASSAQQGSSPAASQSSPVSAGKKRKADSGNSPTAKRGKKNEKEQKTIEESMDIDQPEPESEPAKPDATTEKVSEDDNLADSTKSADAEEKDSGQTNGHAAEQTEQQRTEDKQPDTNSRSNGQAESVEAENESQEESSAQKETGQSKQKVENTETENKQEAGESSKEAPQAEQKTETATNGDNAVEAKAREGQVPSSILEKGIMYLLYRGRVNVESPDSVQDLARSYLILRPLPHDAKLGDGPIGDDKNCRLIAIPKKMLPVSGNDRWIAFTEKVNTTMADLKESFLKDDQYQTQAGERHTPAATPVAEAVYAITTTGRETHLAYITTLPEDLGKIQNDLGLLKQGSFVLSTKNPKAPGPANTNIGKDPGYPSEIQNAFRSLRWAPTQPEHLNYEGCQFLMIGEGEQGLDKATEAQDGDEKKENPKEELKKLEGEDEVRVEHLNGEDAIFADLGTNAKDYPKLQTTW